MKAEMEVLVRLMAGVAERAAVYGAYVSVRPIGAGLEVVLTDPKPHPVLDNVVARLQIFHDHILVGDGLNPEAYIVYPNGMIGSPDGVVPVGEEGNLPPIFRFLVPYVYGEEEVEG